MGRDRFGCGRPSLNTFGRDSFEPDKACTLTAMLARASRLPRKAPPSAPLTQAGAPASQESAAQERPPSGWSAGKLNLSVMI